MNLKALYFQSSWYLRPLTLCALESWGSFSLHNCSLKALWATQRFKEVHSKRTLRIIRPSMHSDTFWSWNVPFFENSDIGISSDKDFETSKNPDFFRFSRIFSGKFPRISRMKFMKLFIFSSWSFFILVIFQNPVNSKKIRIIRGISGKNPDFFFF